MNPLFTSLPGRSMRVPEVARQIAAMWREDEPDKEKALSNAHALQMNLVIHFGIDTGPEDGSAIFDVAIKFSQRYPCRIIVLCPEKPTDEEIGLDAKLYSQCFISNLRENCCCEALILGYGTNEEVFLEDQMSVWLASDLPVYHWLHNASVDLLEANYSRFLNKAKRIVMDTAVDRHGFQKLTCSKQGILSDLAMARTARLRQSLGQFFAATPSRQLADGLKEVKVLAQPTVKAEASRLHAWQKEKLGKCRSAANNSSVKPSFHLLELPIKNESLIESNWTYEDKRTLSWALPVESGTASIQITRNGMTRKHLLRADPYAPEKALSEALFF